MKQNADATSAPAGFSLVAVLGRLTAVLIFAGGVVCGLLVLDHHARSAEGLHTLTLALVIGIMLAGTALGMGLWLFCALLTRTAKLSAFLEQRESGTAKQSEPYPPSLLQLQTSLDDLRELVLLDEKDKAGRRAAVEAVAQERTELRNRLYGEIQTAAGAKNWAEAIRLSRQLLAEHPSSLEAQTVAAKLPTLEANAEISRRQELEQQIKVLVHEQKYPEAVGLARQLIGQYPDSPQAKALVVQLPRLEQLATITLAILNGTLVPMAPQAGAPQVGQPTGSTGPQPPIAPAAAPPGAAETQGK